MDFKNQRKLKQSMVKNLKNTGIKNKRVLEVMSKVDRHKFVNKSYQHFSYENEALPLVSGQTISQPYTIAIMLEALAPKKGDKVLEVGTGSGYNAALLANLVYPGLIFTTEIVEELHNLAKSNLKDYPNVTVLLADGSLGLKEFAPFDKIIVTAACPKIPETLVNQLKNKGVLVAPVGKGLSQEMLRIENINGEAKITNLGYFVFVPLKGKEGF